jgi:hypothetical protein
MTEQIINEYGFGKEYGDKPPDPEQVAICKIQTNCEPRKSFNKDHSSYGFKHIVEAAANKYETNEGWIQNNGWYNIVNYLTTNYPTDHLALAM